MRDQSRGRVRVDLANKARMRGSQYSVSAYAAPFTRPLSAVRAGPQKEGPAKTQKGQASSATPGQQQTEFQDVTAAQSAVVRPGCKDRANDDRSDHFECRPFGIAPEFKRSTAAGRRTRPRLQDDHARVALSISTNHRCAYPRPARHQRSNLWLCE
jgi:hypothetical protein